ncbi:ArsR/SmtB family transcription factor [Candidatus Methanosphaera massiliense]|jgi:ArsR family transcriptional regulator|uniref:ArsR/SmtB family transcription factor n=1 Tax=Methanosphaera TaxID=2316 RepID=UPI0023807061|nr:metalloregulator ArsR/SmtB family transcription factor [Candidatus Methanosphaera massiliense]MDD6286620.1 metalloregulator ArsR/SmtB family transcription factor [Methanobacteriaceae archaeon]MDE4078715.1 metalloregulator ArsR/SmtB family transcription factor [Candidatus Methanosphaera massiliense]
MDLMKNVKICKALSDPTRLEIVTMINGTEKCACRLLEHFDITQPTLSHHMKQLTNCGLVDVRKEGKWSYYSINTDVLTEFKDFVNSLESNMNDTCIEC